MNKFKEVLEAARNRELSASAALLSQPDKRQHRGRPPGKRSHPDFEQITAYIRKDTHQAVKIALLQGGRQEFSELVEILLAGWLKSSR